MKYFESKTADITGAKSCSWDRSFMMKMQEKCHLMQ
jgi:hypothetical protein